MTPRFSEVDLYQLRELICDTLFRIDTRTIVIEIALEQKLKYFFSEQNDTGAPRVTDYLMKMDFRKRVNLTVVQLPSNSHALDAPPILIASTHTIDYCRGGCGEILMHADDQQVQGVLLHCSTCGGYNSTGIITATSVGSLVGV